MPLQDTLRRPPNPLATRQRIQQGEMETLDAEVQAKADASELETIRADVLNDAVALAMWL